MDKLAVVKRILKHLVKDELYPDEFVEGDVIAKHINRAVAIIDGEYDEWENYATEEEYNEVMEKTFNEPYDLDNQGIK